MHPIVSPAHDRVTALSSAPELLLPAPSAPVAAPALTYDSEKYAMLNTPIETERHIDRIMRYLDPKPNERLLEVGCGRGFLTRRMQGICPDTSGIDVNPQCIAHAVAQGLRVMDAVDLRLDDEQFDKIYSFHAIEHIQDAGAALREMRRVLVPGGRILLVYPAEPIRGLYAMPGAWVGFGNPLKARQLHVHKFSPRTIQKLAARAGLAHVESSFSFFITPQFCTVLEKGRRRP